MSKEFLFHSVGLWYLVGIVVSILAAIAFIIIGNWHAMMWALLAGSGDGLALRAEHQLWQIKKERFKDGVEEQ